MNPILGFAAAALAFSGLLLQTVQAAERSTYRWIDDKGRVHFSDVRSEKGQPVQVKPGSGISNVPKDSPAAIAARQQECQRKKEQVAVYNSSAQISETDNLGNTRSYSPQERQKLIDRAEQQAQVACNAPGTVAADARKP